MVFKLSKNFYGNKNKLVELKYGLNRLLLPTYLHVQIWSGSFCGL